MARKAKQGRRTKSGQLSRAKVALIERNPPSERILAHRALFAFVTPTKGPDGRAGEIDQDICDGIGQLHALGLLDGTPFDAQDMRDKGRLYAELYWNRYADTAPGILQYGLVIKETGDGRHKGLNPRAEDLFNKLDMALTGAARKAIMELCVDRAWSDRIVPWAQAQIHRGLMERKVFLEFMLVPMPDDDAKLAALKVGLCALVDGAMPGRWSEAA